MILAGVKLGIANRKAKSSPNEEIVFGEGRPVERIGIILDSLDEVVEQAFCEFLQEFKLNEGSAEIVYCLPVGLNERLEERTFFNGSDISWSGKVTNTRVAAFLERRFDLLICFTKAENKFAEYLLTASKAGLKAGRQQKGKQGCDLVISSSFEEVRIFISEIKKYLKILNRFK